MRRFEKVKRIEEDIKLPKRATKHSVGYDFYAIEDVKIEPISHEYLYNYNMPVTIHCNFKPTLVKTGVKVLMEEDDCLQLCNRSSGPNKGLILANGVGARWRWKSFKNSRGVRGGNARRKIHRV